HRHCMEQCRHRRRCHRGVRQPAVEGKYCRLHPEAEKGRHKHQLQRPLVSRRQTLIQNAAVGEVQV
ncbi:hypothetical protein BBBGCB_BBBGCB_02370, partial [Dysosmobacter welbionis]